MKYELTDEERRRLIKTPARGGFIGVVRFSGPRGGRYRPRRTGACVSVEEAEEKGEAIRSRPWKQIAGPVEVVEIDWRGNTKEEEA
jgi:hypothetical protein